MSGARRSFTTENDQNLRKTTICLEKKLNLFCVMHSNAKFHTLFRFGTPAAISRAVGIATAEKIQEAQRYSNQADIRLYQGDP